MKYLFAIAPKAVAKGIRAAKDGEPVIPAFPIQDDINCFVGVESGDFAPTAVIKNVTDDPKQFVQKLINKLVENYPGIPQPILEQYVINTARVIQESMLDKIYSIFVTRDTAKLRNKEDMSIIPLWTSAPTI